MAIIKGFPPSCTISPTTYIPDDQYEYYEQIDDIIIWKVYRGSGDRKFMRYGFYYCGDNPYSDNSSAIVFYQKENICVRIFRRDFRARDIVYWLPWSYKDTIIEKTVNVFKKSYFNDLWKSFNLE